MHNRDAVRAAQNLRGTYNMPTANEVCYIFDRIPDGCARDVLIWPTGDNTLSKIHTLNPNRDSLVYPILFPNADQTYEIRKFTKTNAALAKKFVSCREYYAFILMPRKDVFNQILFAGKLTQQFVIEASLKIEDARLEFFRSEENQTRLRIDTYKGLHDYVDNEADKANVKAGRIFILPSSFTGSERNNTQNFMDAMCVVEKYGKPDYFLTYTCNKTWPEITSGLQTGAVAEDRPDLVSRVYHAKLTTAFSDLKTVFGI